MATEPKKASRHAIGSNGPTFATEVERQLRELDGLQPNWDGYGASAIDRVVIQAACAFTRALPADVKVAPRVVPMSDGNLQLEWHCGTRILELEFENSDTIRYLQWHPDEGLEEESTFPVLDIDSAVELIRWFEAGAAA